MASPASAPAVPAGSGSSPSSAAANTPSEKRHFNPWLTLVIVCVAQFMVVLDATIVNVALPSIQKGLHFSRADLQWVINGYTLLFGGFLLLGGRAADLLGRRRLFTAGVILFSLASAVNAFAQSSNVLIAGRALQVVIEGGHHEELFDTFVSAADRYLDEHYMELRSRFEAEAPRWVPDAVYRRLFDRLYNRLRQRLAAMADDPDDQTRRQFEAWIAGLPDRLETSPELRERGERLKREVLGSAVLRDWSSSLWRRIKEGLRTQAADPDSELRRRMADVLVAAGRRLGSDRRLADGLDHMVESGARALADQFHDELAGLVTGTIQRWDAAETSSQLELLLGRDLQYIRINGTVVGAAVGLVLHVIVVGVG